jgi:hypothetical protein
MKKSVVLFAISMLLIIAVKAQTAPAPKPKPAPAPTATTHAAEVKHTGVQAPKQSPSTGPAQTPSQTPSTAPAKKGPSLVKVGTHPTHVVKAAPATAKDAQKVQQK